MHCVNAMREQRDRQVERKQQTHEWTDIYTNRKIARNTDIDKYKQRQANRNGQTNRKTDIRQTETTNGER